MKVISYAGLDRQYEAEKSELLEAFQQVASSGQFILGSHVDTLENEIAEFIGVEHCVTLNSGTDALLLGMHALGIGRGDEVITPPNSFVASTASIVHIGAKPIFVDVKDDQNLNIDLIESAITEKTKAIMPVHLTGRVCDMDPLLKIAQKYNLLIVEDAAQSFGSMYGGKKSGSFGDIGCFSAHPLKLFNACGDAGFITTNDKHIADHIKRIRSHGFEDRNTISQWGFVSRLDTLQAVILRMRLTKIKGYINKRRENVALYRKKLNSNHVFIPPCKEKEFNTFQTFVIQVDNRDALQTFLKENGVESNVHYPVPIHKQKPFEKMASKKCTYPKTEEQSGRILSLPVSQFLTTEEINHICYLVNTFYQRESNAA